MALRDDDKVMAGMLRRTLASSTGPHAASTSGKDCPPADILAAYYERSLGNEESAGYELHFSNCALCREQLAAMVRAEEVPQAKHGWAWLWNPYLLAPAVAVLALAIFFGAHRSGQTATNSQPANAPLVAMSRSDQPSPADELAPPPPALTAPAAGAPSSNLQKSPSDSSERDSLSKAEESQALASAAQNARQSAAEPSPLLNELSDKRAGNLPLNGSSINTPKPAAPSASPQPINPVPQSAAPSAMVAAPAPPVQSTVASARAASASGSAGAVPAAAPPAAGKDANADSSVTAESVNRAQAQAPAAMSRYAGAAALGNIQSAKQTAQISRQKVFQTPNTNVLWRPAAGGFVERSVDGGATWNGQPLPGLTGEIVAGSSPTPKICWLVGTGDTIFMTKDATNWKKIVPPVAAAFSAVAAKDASNATVTAADGRVFQTTDGGKHWKPLP